MPAGTQPFNTRQLAATAVVGLVLGHFACGGDSPGSPSPNPSATPGVAPPGTWTGDGTNDDGSTYQVCFQVSADGRSLTTTGSGCADGASFVGEVQGTDNLGDPCLVAVQVLEDHEISRVGTFEIRPPDATGALTFINGTGFPSPTMAIGGIERNDLGRICAVLWAASPAG